MFISSTLFFVLLLLFYKNRLHSRCVITVAILACDVIYFTPTGAVAVAATYAAFECYNLMSGSLPVTIQKWSVLNTLIECKL